jgi:hypothetical protein
MLLCPNTQWDLELFSSSNHISPILNRPQARGARDVKRTKTQYVEARCYPKKRCLGFDFKFKKFSIKQAIFITDIFPSHIKAPKQKKI